MDILETLGSTLGLGFLAGMRLYLTVFVLGLASYFGWLDWSPMAAHMKVLGHPFVLITSGVLALAEFISDKVPWFDSMWDSIHTFVRPLGAMLLAGVALGPMDPAAKLALTLITGGVALSSHSSKAATRMIVNHSPEPLSNIALSLAGDLAIPTGTWFVMKYPEVALGFVIVFLLLFSWLAPKIFRLLKMEFLALRGLWNRLAGAERASTAPVITLPPTMNADAATMLHALADKMDPMPETWRELVRGKLNLERVPEGIHCVASRGLRGLSNSTGYLFVADGELIFVTQRTFRFRSYRVPLVEIDELRLEKGLMLDTLYVKHKDRIHEFELFKVASRAEHGFAMVQGTAS
jgi:uncharacterized membrane protein